MDTNALVAHNVTPAELVSAMGRQNLVLPTGSMKIGAQDFDIKLNGNIPSIAEIGEIPVRHYESDLPGVNGRTLLVKDLANVRDGFDPATTIARQNGSRSVLNSVLAYGGVSTIAAVDHVKNSIPQILASMPEGLDIQLMFDQSVFVRAAIGNVLHEGLIAASLTAAMILLFLGNWRSTCIIAISIPLAIMSSLIALYLLGQTINLMTLGGLALAIGILVDDATVEIENIERQLALGKPPVQAILDGAREIAAPAFVSTLCICIVFVPMFFLDGFARSLFVPMGQAVVFAMLASYLISRTLVPTLVMYMLRNHQHHTNKKANTFDRIHHAFNRGFETFRDHYTALVQQLLTHRKTFAAAFLACCVLSLGLVPKLGQDLFPVVDSGQMRLHLRAPSGTRLEQMPALVDRVEDVIRSRIPAEQMGEMLDIIGGPYSPINTLNGNSGTTEAADAEIMISIRRGKLGTPDIMRDLRLELPRLFPDVEFYFQPADQMGQILNFGMPAPIDVQFVGGRPEQLLPLAAELNNRLRSIPGLVDAHVYQRWSKPTLALNMDRGQLQELGLSARDVAENMMITLSGSMQTSPTNWLNEANGNTYNIGPRATEIDLDSIDALLQTPIGAGADGRQHQLGSVVTYERTVQSSVITRRNSINTINIHASVQDRDLGAVIRDIENVLEEFRPQLPRGVTLELRGQSDTLKSAFTGLGYGLIVAIALVYLLVVVNFQSWLDPLIIIGALPAALAGIAWMLFLSGTTLSVPALTGTVMCMGVATANSILLVSFARSRLSEGVTPDQAALQAASTRLRPVLMTAFAMIAGMLPMALGLGIGGEQNAPLGRAVIGGLIMATLSTLLFVPVIFAGAHRWLAARALSNKNNASANPEPQFL
ncbi:MAG: efflux RND transporter permease subunit [Cellvibrionaceae bacterium]|nr:efflux RND transporter permease subunit [Cellvibrionaceae bacterium]